MARNKANNIFWFRNDLRLADNPGLIAAQGRAGKTAFVYILDDEASGKWTMGGASRWWLHFSLQALGEAIAALGGRLLLRRGDAAVIIPELARSLKAEEVHASASLEPAAKAQDAVIAERLRAQGAMLCLHQTRLLFPLADITTKAGGAYGVYTPFSRACLAHAPPPDPVPAPEKLVSPAAAGERLADWRLLPTRPDWAGGLRAAWKPGEAGAMQRMRTFLEQGVEAYQTGRNLPAISGTSSLSPHLHFGEISPALLWHESGKAHGPGAAQFRRELIWREFSSYLLHHHPQMPDAPLRPVFAKFPWVHDPEHLRAWQQGRTGIPIVDAGMRQLWRTGWMHNRIRMVCASFLVKHLLISWVEGEAWFWDTLVDADLANNSNNWQWIAGCGADAAPYFRIFNPVLQGRKFDPQGEYVLEYVPELRHLSSRYIHAPWEADAGTLAAAQLELGKTYPAPIIDLSHGRERALAVFRKTTRRND